MGKTKLLGVGILLVLFLPFVLAIPGLPHQFYGSVIVNGQPAQDNNIITVNIGEESYVTATKDGKYGYSPNIFYAEDPEGENSGKTISFTVGGMDAGNYDFENNGYTKFDIVLTTTCGDSYCLGDETCSNCPDDCGVCTDPPIITINSPINKAYDTLEIDLDVSADQEILIWMYSLNSEDLITFTPNIAITAQEGENKVSVVGINEAFQSGNSEVTFTVELAQEDPPANNPGGGGNNNPGGGGSSPSGSNTNTNTNEGTKNNQITTSDNGEDKENNENTQTEETGKVEPGITGSVVEFVRTGKGIGAVIFVVVVVGLIVFVNVKKKGEKKELKGKVDKILFEE